MELDKLSKIFLKKNSFLFFSLVISTSLFGLIILLSSSPLTFKYFIKQFLWLLVGLTSFIFFSLFDYNKLRSLTKFLIILTFILLILVLFVNKGKVDRWFKLKFISFQPSELAKFSIILLLAWSLEKKTISLASILFIVFSISCLILRQPDFGIPILIFLITFSLLFIAGVRFKFFIICLFFLIPLIVLGLIQKPYRIERVKAFLYEPTKLHQIKQSEIALGSGGLFGKGLGKGEIKRYFLPASHTDFIFSIIGEELGFIGGCVVILIFLCFLFVGYKIAINAGNLFGGLLCSGFILSIVLQAFINIGGCCGVLPLKGSPLPFFSYGGSSLLYFFSACGVCLNISLQNKK